MSTKENPSEEIDLGQLFKLIGNIFDKFYKFIQNLFRIFFNRLILSLQFIQKHFLKFVIAGVLGVVIGWCLDSIADPIYKSSMIVQPNFNSAQQLYNNIEFYNELAEEEEYRTLALTLKISDKEASTIKEVVIESYSDKTQKIKQFSQFIKELDTISQKQVDYEDFLKNFNDINSKYHKIEFSSIDSEVAKKCQKIIVSSIENNTYFSKKKRTNDINLELGESIIKQQLREIDSLNTFYKELKILELKRPEGTSGTNINLASESKDLEFSEIMLLDKSKTLNDEIQLVNKKKTNTENIINVISDFPEKGSLVDEMFTRKIVLTPILLILTVFIGLILLAFNKYLKNYNK